MSFYIPHSPTQWRNNDRKILTQIFPLEALFRRCNDPVIPFLKVFPEALYSYTLKGFTGSAVAV